MSYNDLIAKSNLSYGSGQYKNAIEFAELARAEAKNDIEKADTYVLAGKAYMSMEQMSKAEDCFLSAINLVPNNGNVLYLLGYAQVMEEKTTNALKSFTRALENNCDSNLKGQIYKIIAIINREQRDYENALISLEQAEKYLGFDYELLQLKAACYSQNDEYMEAMFTLNQMKLLKPGDYQPYSLAFQTFMEIKLYDEARAELERAKTYANIDMQYYKDNVIYILYHDPNADTKESFMEKQKHALEMIQIGLEEGRPTIEQAVDAYLQAASILLSLEDPKIALACLKAAENPVESFNEGFKITEIQEINGKEEQQKKSRVLSMAELRKYADKTSSGGIQEAALSPMVGLPTKKENEEYKLDGVYIFSQGEKDYINSLYLTVYEKLLDYDGMLQKARELQCSESVASNYCGMFYELRVSKLLNEEKWQTKYRDRINYWMKQMILNPNDYVAASYRIRAYVDLGDRENAEMLMDCLPSEIKESLKKELGEGEYGG